VKITDIDTAVSTKVTVILIVAMTLLFVASIGFFIARKRTGEKEFTIIGGIIGFFAVGYVLLILFLGAPQSVTDAGGRELSESLHDTYGISLTTDQAKDVYRTLNSRKSEDRKDRDVIVVKDGDSLRRVALQVSFGKVKAYSVDSNTELERR
jgi:hypothetical protein